MSGGGEDWSDWDALDGEGLDSVPWEDPKRGRIAERGARYKAGINTEKTGIRRYEIRWAVLDPSRGSEMAKTRPVVIVSLDELNRRLRTVTVCPITSERHPAWRSRLPVRCAGRPAEIAVDQIRTISKTRLAEKLGVLSEREASSLRRLITEMFGE
jgi:mRNA interferase MazF